MRKVTIPTPDCQIVETTLALLLDKASVAAVTNRLFVIEEPMDSVMERLAGKIMARAAKGNVTYGCTLSQQTMPPIQALREAEEEITDAMAYLGKYLQDIVANEDKASRVCAILDSLAGLTIALSTIIHEVENDYTTQIPSNA